VKLGATDGKDKDFPRLVDGRSPGRRRGIGPPQILLAIQNVADVHPALSTATGGTRYLGEPQAGQDGAVAPAAGAALAAITRFRTGRQAEIKVGLLERLFVVAQRWFIGGQRHGKSRWQPAV
jgi:hypothetical protein